MGTPENKTLYQGVIRKIVQAFEAVALVGNDWARSRNNQARRKKFPFSLCALPNPQGWYMRTLHPTRGLARYLIQGGAPVAGSPAHCSAEA
jgi:hypothetical protein